MMLYPAGLENHPDGSGNINAILNGNWGNLSAAFNPAHGLTCSQSTVTLTASASIFTSDDVGATIRFADKTTDIIAAYISATQVTMTTSQTKTTQAFELYRIGESQRGALLRGLTKRPRLISGDDGKLMAYDHTSSKLRFITSLAEVDNDLLVPVGTKLGIGITPSYPLHVQVSDTGSSAVLASRIEIFSAPSGGTNSNEIVPLTIYAKQSAGTNSNTGPGVNPLRLVAENANTGTVALLQGLTIDLDQSAAGTITDAVGLRIVPTFASGSVTTFTGILLATSSGSFTTRWGIYSPDANQNFHIAGKVGIGTTSLTGDLALLVDRTSTLTGGTAWGAALYLTANPASSSSAQFYGADIRATSDGAQNLTDGNAGLVGVLAYADHNGTGTATMIQGGRFFGRKRNTGAATSAMALYAQVRNENASGAITDGYGLFIEAAQATGTITNKWGVYQNGGSGESNYFGSKIGLGTTSWGSGEKVLAIGNATTVPSTNPSSGGVLYVEAGALKYRGSSGTVTPLANA